VWQERHDPQIGNASRSLSPLTSSTCWWCVDPHSKTVCITITVVRWLWLNEIALVGCVGHGCPIFELAGIIYATCLTRPHCTQPVCQLTVARCHQQSIPSHCDEFSDHRKGASERTKNKSFTLHYFMSGTCRRTLAESVSPMHAAHLTHTQACRTSITHPRHTCKEKQTVQQWHLRSTPPRHAAMEAPPIGAIHSACPVCVGLFGRHSGKAVLVRL